MHVRCVIPGNVVSCVACACMQRRVKDRAAAAAAAAASDALTLPPTWDCHAHTRRKNAGGSATERDIHMAFFGRLVKCNFYLVGFVS